ncbi:divisome protein SepX/GlpR [Corynebacterium heidelbergense]|uniref:divisome protein SepX/GlpR n=1 Tax=Corynebacterium heidelbergense TaxID=2055947 RepID=UPI0015EF8FFF|nr:gephyrin-like molybdotransferase receptor GlpR [Corynebacterium heidelbergense]WCZ37125.1 hypothetical protein CHEID_07970 [Corynebacterium heidelbergense]
MSGSLLLIAAVWLLLLAPLLLRRQSPVRRTSPALAETRVVHEGGTELASRRRRPLPAEGHYVDEDEDIEFVDAEPEYVIVDDATNTSAGWRSRFGGSRRSSNRRQEAAETGDSHGDDLGNEAVAEPSTDLVPVAEAASGRDGAEAADLADAGATEAGDLAILDGEVVAEDDGEADELNNSGARAVRASKITRESREAPEAESGEDAVEEPGARPRQRFASVSEAYVRGVDVHAELTPLEEAAAGAGASTELEFFTHSSELSQEDIAYIERRRGRGVYDPVASQVLAQRRLRRRKQVLTALLVLSVLSIGLALWIGGSVWLAVVAMLGATGVYLYYLRKQAIEEAQLRDRRLSRMRRARLGVRNTEDVDLGVPDRLLRPGAVILETDEEAPEFEHLRAVDGADFFGPEVEEGPALDATAAAPVGRTHMRAV